MHQAASTNHQISSINITVTITITITIIKTITVTIIITINITITMDKPWEHNRQTEGRNIANGLMAGKQQID